MPSAYSKLQTFSSPILIPMYKLFKTRLSKKRLNNKGDKTHPCLKPPETMNQSVVTELTRTQGLTGEWSDFTAIIILSLVPSSCNLHHSCWRLMSTINKRMWRLTLCFFMASIMLAKLERWTIVFYYAGNYLARPPVPR